MSEKKDISNKLFSIFKETLNENNAGLQRFRDLLDEDEEIINTTLEKACQKFIDSYKCILEGDLDFLENDEIQFDISRKYNIKIGRCFNKIKNNEQKLLYAQYNLINFLYIFSKDDRKLALKLVLDEFNIEDENKVKLEKISVKCIVCGKLPNFQCDKCKTTYYCSEECLTKDYNFHKEICGTKEIDLSTIIPNDIIEDDKNEQDPKKIKKNLKKGIKDFKKSLDAHSGQWGNNHINIARSIIDNNDTKEGLLNIAAQVTGNPKAINQIIKSGMKGISKKR